MDNTFDEGLVRRLAQENGIARSLFKTFSGRVRQSKETIVDSVSAPRAEVIGLFKQFQNIGLGTFKTGRRGQKSRFIWEVNVIEVGKATCDVQGPSTLGEDVTTAECDDGLDEEKSRATWIKHEYRLRRPDVYAVFNLPDDLTASEAERLARFINTLPVE